MGRIINKSNILERIKEYYKIKSNAELSRFLGISPSTLSNWYSRNTIDYDLIFHKCEDMDLDWLINGISTPPQFENTEEEQLTNKDEYSSSTSEFNLDQIDWKDHYGFMGFMNTILKRNKAEKINSSYSDINSTIDLLSTYLKHYSFLNKSMSCYENIKSNKINIQEVIGKTSDILSVEKELYDIIVPYEDILNSLYHEVDKFNMEHDRLYCFTFPDEAKQEQENRDSKHSSER